MTTDRDLLQAELEYYDSLAVTMLTEEPHPRNGALNNIRQSIKNALSDLIEPEGKRLARYVIANAREEINKLLNNPDYWGSHEFLKEEEPIPGTVRHPMDFNNQ